MAVFSVQWAPSLVDAVTDALIKHGSATSGDVARSAKHSHDDVLGILRGLSDAGYACLSGTDGPFGEEGGSWSLTAAGRAEVVAELREARQRILTLEQCIADGLRRWDLTLDYVDPLGELLPDMEGWEHYEWRTAASQVLAGDAPAAPLRKRERDPEVHGAQPLFVADGSDPEPEPVYFSVLGVEGVKVKITHSGQSPLWINGVSVYQPDNGPAYPEPALDNDDAIREFSWVEPDAAWPDGVLPSEFPDPDARWTWPGPDDGERRVVRTVRVFGREVLSYTSTRRSPGRIRDALLKRRHR